MRTGKGHTSHVREWQHVPSICVRDSQSANVDVVVAVGLSPGFAALRVAFYDVLLTLLGKEQLQAWGGQKVSMCRFTQGVHVLVRGTTATCT